MLNICVLLGNVGKKEPVAKESRNHRWNISFSMATNETYTKPTGEVVDKADWHRIVCWTNDLTKGKGKVVMDVKPGELIAIIGKKRCQSWTGTDGQKRYEHFVDISDFGSRLDRVKRPGPPAQKMSQDQDGPEIDTTVDSSPEGEFPFGDEVQY